MRNIRETWRPDYHLCLRRIGQSIRVNDPHENATWVYNCDCGGIIPSRVKYGYPIGTPGAPIDRFDYAYEDTDRKDKLRNR